MKFPPATLTMLVACSLLWTGCQSTGDKRPIDTKQYELENQLHAVHLGPGLQDRVAISNIQESKTDDARLKEVAVGVINLEKLRLQVQINCEFQDSQGFVVDSLPFQNLFLDGGAQQTVRFPSVHPQATHYAIHLRRPR